MRYIFVWLLATVALGSCTDAAIVYHQCGGGFTIAENIECVSSGSVTVAGSTNVKRQSIFTDIRQNSVHPKEAQVVVSGQLDDSCAGGSISYSFVCGGTTITRNKTINGGTATASAPTNVFAAESGGFSYEVDFVCCTGNNASHDVEVYSPRTRTIFAAALPLTIQCPGNGKLTVSGQLANPKRGTFVDVSIHGPNGTCKLTTNIRVRG